MTMEDKIFFVFLAIVVACFAILFYADWFDNEE